MTDDPLHCLLALSRDLGREGRGLAILGEGNASAKLSADRFLVKASGASLASLDGAGVVECRSAPLLALLDQPAATDAEVEAALYDARVDAAARKPSVEAVFHAFLLSLDGVNFVAHTHPTAVNGVLCSPAAGAFAGGRLFPDQIVCCGPADALVPYVDPGPPLARAIRQAVRTHEQRHGRAPRVILLANHGLIAPAATAAGALAATRMAEKAAAVVPGKLDESLIIEAIRHDGLEMPPTGKLDDAKIATLTRWVESGAAWPGGGGHASTSAPATARVKEFSAEDRAWWAFQPLRRPEVPAVEDGGWSRNPIDRFLFARLEAEGLAPAPEADRTALIRRLSFDLLGLPPSPEEVDAFVADDGPDAYEHLVDRLLDSPRYGERWARHWLDLVRYAESDGYNQDAYRPHAWRYRDYVVRSLNADKPYDRFLTEQLAGDEIAPGDLEMMVAVGYFRLGTYEYNQSDIRTHTADILNDVTDVSADVFLGLGMGCARCHDHKFDPILQKDYFRLQAFFDPLVPRDEVPLAAPDEVMAYQRDLAAWEAMTAEVRSEIDAIEKPHLEKLAHVGYKKVPPDVRTILDAPPERRTPHDQKLALYANFLIRREREKFKAEATLKGEALERWKALQDRLAAYEQDKPKPLPAVLTVTDVGPVASPVLIPGDRTGEAIEPGFPTILDPNPARTFRLPGASNSTGRRTALAQWLTRPDNPLSTRVVANRLWQYHFGRGLVATPSDFGRLGEAPSHPDLLDWLATEFVANGWSFKDLHRLIVTTAAYRQTALRPTPKAARLADPEDRLLWRRTTRRLDAEQIRDAMLFASGELDPTMGGEGVDGSKPRRTIYTKVLRNKPDPLLDAFDAPDGSITTCSRNSTTIPTQALLLINGEWSLDRARAFAGRLRSLDAPGDRVDIAYRIAFGRAPGPDERAEAIAFLETQGSLDGDGSGADAALVDLCHALLNSNEFLYVD